MRVPFGYRSKLISTSVGQSSITNLSRKHGTGSLERMTLTSADLPPDSSDLNHSNGYSTEEHGTTQLKRKLGI